MGGILPSMVSLRSAGKAGPSKFADPNAGSAPPSSCCCSRSFSDTASCVSSSCSDNAPCVSPSSSESASCVSRSCSVKCCSCPSSRTLSCGVPFSTMISSPADFMPRSSLPVPSPPVYLGPSIHCTACLSTIFLDLTSDTLTVPVENFRGIHMNTHFSPFGAILCSRTLCRAYPTAPNGRK